MYLNRPYVFNERKRENTFKMYLKYLYKAPCDYYYYNSKYLQDTGILVFARHNQTLKMNKLVIKTRCLV